MLLQTTIALYGSVCSSFLPWLQLLIVQVTEAVRRLTADARATHIVIEGAHTAAGVLSEGANVTYANA